MGKESPVTPHASREAKELLGFLYSIKGKYTLTGEHNFASGLGRYDDMVDSITGKRPVVWGSDFSFNDIGEGFERYQHAGPATITIPFDSPCVHTGLSLDEARQGIVDEAIKKWNEGRIITLMWHCVDPREGGTNDAYPYADFYPGNDYVDVLAADIYNYDFKQSHHDELVELGGGKPIAMGEVGQLPDGPKVFSEQPDWCWFMVWGYFIGSHRSEAADPGANVRSIYDDPRMLTADEVVYENGRHKVVTAKE